MDPRFLLEDGTFVVKGEVLRVPYDGLPVDIWWRYDWRADLRFNAHKLLQTLRDESQNGVRWNLIGHSQGGLVIVLASKLAESPREFASIVGRWHAVDGIGDIGLSIPRITSEIASSMISATAANQPNSWRRNRAI